MQEITTFLGQHSGLTLALAMIALFLVVVEFMRLKRKTASLSALQVTQMINHDQAVIIDIRSSDVYKKGHIIDAVSISANELSETPKKLDKYKSKPIIVVCNAGLESQKLAAQLLKQGYNAFALSGGMRAWNAANMPFVRD